MSHPLLSLDGLSAQNNLLFLSKSKFILETHFNPVSPKATCGACCPSGLVCPPSAEPPSPVHLATLCFASRLYYFPALLPATPPVFPFPWKNPAFPLSAPVCIPSGTPSPLQAQGRLQTAAPTQNLPEHLLWTSSS